MGILWKKRPLFGYGYMKTERKYLDDFEMSLLEKYGIKILKKRYDVSDLLDMLPKKWKETWERPADPEVEKATNDALYTLGNLAIIPGALNSSISNAPWQVKLNGKGNKEGLLKNATGLITLDGCLSKENWDLACIRERAEKLYQQILQVWPEEWDKEYQE